MFESDINVNSFLISQITQGLLLVGVYVPVCTCP